MVLDDIVGTMLLLLDFGTILALYNCIYASYAIADKALHSVLHKIERKSDTNEQGSSKTVTLAFYTTTQHKIIFLTLDNSDTHTIFICVTVIRVTNKLHEKRKEYYNKMEKCRDTERKGRLQATNGRIYMNQIKRNEEKKKMWKKNIVLCTQRKMSTTVAYYI